MVRITNQDYNIAEVGNFEKINGDYFKKVILSDSQGNFINPFAPPSYDEIELGYITTGNGTGEIGTVTYKLNDSVVSTLTLSYDDSNRLIGVSKS